MVATLQVSATQKPKQLYSKESSLKILKNSNLPVNDGWSGYKSHGRISVSSFCALKTCPKIAFWGCLSQFTEIFL
jgi:hypothetical protein